MIDVFLGLGSNQEPKRHLAAGIVALQQRFGELQLSPVYRSEAVGFSGSDFLNAAARIQTEIGIAALKDWLTELENRHGRDRSQPRFSDRSLDIDILLYGDEVGNFDGLELPRGEILKYAHVLKPLADIAPALVHPLTGVTMGDHWQRFEGDRSLTPLG